MQASPMQPLAHAPISAEEAARNRLVIGLLLISAFVVILNETIMGVALPRLMEDLAISASLAQWLTTAFLLTMAVVIPITGFLLQRLNTRPVFLVAMSSFAVGTLVCALAPGFPMLVAGRVIQAVGTAIMMPLLMTTVMNLVPPETRGRTMGNISIVISVAPALGPTISGIILNYLDWRWMFWLVLPIALGALVLGHLRIVNVTTPRYAPLDLLSVLLSALGFGGLVYGLSAIGEAVGGHEGPPVWMPIVGGSVIIVLFVLRQLQLQKSDRALLDLRTFISPIFTVAVLMLAVAMMALFGTIILLPLYMQNVLGLTPITSGLLLLPGGLVMGLMAPFVGRAFDRLGPTPLLVPGAIITSGALWSMTLLNETSAMGWLLTMHIALSIGLALMFTPLFTSGLAALPSRLYSHGSAVVGTLQQVAGAAGIALFVSLMTIETARLTSAGVAPVVAEAGGIHAAFLCGAFISLLLVAAAFFVKRPKGEAGAVPVGSH
ncbi:MFS transporter, DHA2 family, lincomycin resistance protein [Devosia enhydra]|uniref:MFS transporter, DHA2 family, lincomycin resistance protein n=1 Tax=Devosia enhydra TaxID=665118 RepID=A0A1K2HUN6_9HYPH|nr:MDR family MFS transporter [Devosia enhydra]SFZ82242.1 MFS transporter, DHA2 family, lincomycin resistance protein [Devosia enhydra]